MARNPVRATAPRTETPAAAQAKAPKTRLRKNAAARSLLDIDAAIVAKVKDEYGQDLQWVTDSILGQPSPQSRNAFEINGWEAVTPDMFDGVFDGMYTKRGHTGEIQYEGLVLMYRPIELTREAQAEDRQARDAAIAAQQAMIKGGGAIQGLAPGFEADHQTALGRNVFRRSVEAPMPVPRE